MEHRLSRCLQGYHKILDHKQEMGILTEEEVAQIKQLGAKQISLWLSSRCLSFRESLMTVLENRLKSQDLELARDSVKKYEHLHVNDLPLRWELLEYYLSASEWFESEQLLKRLLKEYPNSEFGHWVQSYFHHRRRDYKAARASIDSALENAKEEHFMYILHLYKNAYGPIDRNYDQEFILEFQPQSP
ncbi:MAG: hypothetical protein AAGD28_02120 [Bacteroidota bacterium]